MPPTGNGRSKTERLPFPRPNSGQDSARFIRRSSKNGKVPANAGGWSMLFFDDPDSPRNIPAEPTRGRIVLGYGKTGRPGLPVSAGSCPTMGGRGKPLRGGPPGHPSNLSGDFQKNIFQHGRAHALVPKTIRTGWTSLEKQVRRRILNVRPRLDAPRTPIHARTDFHVSKRMIHRSPAGNGDGCAALSNTGKIRTRFVGNSRSGLATGERMTLKDMPDGPSRGLCPSRARSETMKRKNECGRNTRSPDAATPELSGR